MNQSIRRSLRFKSEKCDCLTLGEYELVQGRTVRGEAGFQIEALIGLETTFLLA